MPRPYSTTISVLKKAMSLLKILFPKVQVFILVRLPMLLGLISHLRFWSAIRTKARLVVTWSRWWLVVRSSFNLQLLMWSSIVQRADIVLWLAFRNGPQMLWGGLPVRSSERVESLGRRWIMTLHILLDVPEFRTEEFGIRSWINTWVNRRNKSLYLHSSHCRNDRNLSNTKTWLTYRMFIHKILPIVFSQIK